MFIYSNLFFGEMELNCLS